MDDQQTAAILYVACLVCVLLMITWFFFSIMLSRRVVLASGPRPHIATVAHESKGKGKGKGLFEVVCKPSDATSFAIGVSDRVSVVVLNP